VSTTCHSPAAVNETGLRKKLSNSGALPWGITGDGRDAPPTGSASGTTVESSSVGSLTTELATSPVGGAVDCAALVATLALCGADEAAGVVCDGGGA
jgi:hypothetical protein